MWLGRVGGAKGGRAGVLRAKPEIARPGARVLPKARARLLMEWGEIVLIGDSRLQLEGGSCKLFAIFWGVKVRPEDEESEDEKGDLVNMYVPGLGMR